MVSHPVMRGMVGHPAPIYRPRPNPLPQGYSFGYALPHGRPGYDFGYALPYRGGYYGRGYYYGGGYGGYGGGYDPGGYYYDAGQAQGAAVVAPPTVIYEEGPPYPVGYYGASDTATGNGVIYNLPFAFERPGPKIIRVSRRHGLGAAQPHVTVIRGGVVSVE